jgi:selenocysteine lyase/cysteine desulfurase
MEPPKLAEILFDKYKIFTVAINGAGVHGCRVTPNVYTTTEELDVLVDALSQLG